MGKLDDYHYHEIMDRAHVVTDHFYEYVETHPAVISNPELKELAEKVTSLMYKFYNTCSAYSDIKSSDRAEHYEENVE